MVVLDTSVIIDHLRNKDIFKGTLLMQCVRSFDDLAISILTIQELFTGTSSRNKVIGERMLELIEPLQILPYTFEIAVMAGEIIRDLKRPIGFVDAAIAATTIINKSKLLTLNLKDFGIIENLRLVKIQNGNHNP